MYGDAVFIDGCTRGGSRAGSEGKGSLGGFGKATDQDLAVPLPAWRGLKTE